MNTLTIGAVQGLAPQDETRLAQLVEVYNYHKTRNDIKETFYDGQIRLSDVNLGIALPRNLSGLEIGCEWGGKAVDVLAGRSMFDGYVGQNGLRNDRLDEIMDANRVITEYAKATKNELIYGSTFATLSADYTHGVKIRWHSPQDSSALWSGEKGRIDCGLAIIDTAKDERYKNVWTPSRINLYTNTDIIVLTKGNNQWYADYHPHKMGIPLMLNLSWNPTSSKPFGRSRLKAPVRHLIEGYVRTIANATIGLEFATSPQKYLLGITDDQYDAVINDKFRQYVGSIIAATNNPETGEKPAFGQLQQGSITPHIEMMRLLATQFSAATGLSVTDTGIVNDANPTSSDAILAQSQTLVNMAEQLNSTNGDALKLLAQMVLAIDKNCTLAELTNEDRDIVAHFKNPAMPSIASTADAALKIATKREEFAQTDVFLEMVGFDQADIRRINAQEARVRGSQTLGEEF